jgi:hypothetical protein
VILVASVAITVVVFGQRPAECPIVPVGLMGLLGIAGLPLAGRGAGARDGPRHGRARPRTKLGVARGTA